MKLPVEKLIKITVSNTQTRENESYYFDSLPKCYDFFTTRNLDLAFTEMNTCFGLKCEEENGTYYYPVKLTSSEFVKTDKGQKDRENDHEYWFDSKLLNNTVDGFYSVFEKISYEHDWDFGPCGKTYHNITETLQNRDFYANLDLVRCLHVTNNGFQLCDVYRSKNNKIFLGENPAKLKADMDKKTMAQLDLLTREQNEINRLQQELNARKESLSTGKRKLSYLFTDNKANKKIKLDEEVEARPGLGKT